MAKEIAERMRKVQAAVNQLPIYQHDSSNVVTQNFGFMRFDENGTDLSARLPQYIRLSLDTSAKTVVRFMREGWGLRTPDLIISVTGGAKSFDMSTRLRKIFQRGLVAAAITTNAWLITAGTNAGVVKEVGEALNNYRYKNRQYGLDIHCIGIGSWGYTAGNEQLDHTPVPLSTNASTSRAKWSFTRNTTSQAVNAVRMEVGEQYCVRNYVVKRRPEKRCELEANHTHFLLFDDGQAKADTVLQLRAEIENCSRQVNLEAQAEGTTETQIPIVMVLVEGGPSSIRTICQALEMNTPVVVVKDSGRAADLVAELYACFTENNDGNTGHPSRPQTSAGKSGYRENEANGIFAKVRADDNPWVDEIKTLLCQVLVKHKDLVTIFKFDSKRHHGNLEDAILEALFNAAKSPGEQNDQQRRVAELKLAMAWRKFDYVQNNLLTDKTISKWKPDELRRALVDALCRGHVDFVELLIEFGTPLEKLTNKDLEYLYSTANVEDLLLVKKRSKRARRAQKEFYHDYFHSIFGKNNMMVETNDDLPLGKNAPRDLFFWAVFLNRFELATYLCSKTWNPSIAPLFGAHIYHRAARLVLDSDTKQRYEENADQFDLHAMSIIDRCFDNDENFAVDILKRPAAPFNNVNPLYLAQKSNCRGFLASKCVQRYLDNEWFGYINYKRSAINFRVFLCSLFLPLIPIFCFFLPYVQKRKKTGQNPSKVNQPAVIHSVAETEHGKERDPVPWMDKIGYFYQAPIVRFYYYTIFFVSFLLLFSFVLLVDYFPLNTSGGRRSGIQNLRLPITEIILHICLWSLIIEELRQFISFDSKREYISEVWNMIDDLAIILYLVGFITRFFVNEALFTVSKIFLGVDLILWYVRTLHLFAAYEKLGPKLIMIFNTMKDLLFFICFIFIFLMGFSITSWSLITTTNQVNWTYTGDGTTNVTITNGGSGLWNWEIIRDVINYGVWKIFGQVDSIDGTNAYSDTAFVLAIIFVAIANVLLLNVLVALFNITIRNVEIQSYRIWRYQRFLIVVEYAQKPLLPPPFNTIYYLFVGTRYLIRKIRVCCERRRHAVADEPIVMNGIDIDDKSVHEEFKTTDAMQRESAIADDYWRYTFKHGKQNQVEVSLQHIERKLHDLKERIQNNNPNNQVVNFEPQWLTTEG